MSLSFTLNSALCTLNLSLMEPTHLSNTAPHPVMENTRGIWSAVAGIGEFGEKTINSHFHHFHHYHGIHRLRRLAAFLSFTHNSSLVTFLQHRQPPPPLLRQYIADETFCSGLANKNAIYVPLYTDSRLNAQAVPS
jgi:hypothetical protein